MNKTRSCDLVIIGRQFLANGQPNFLGSLIRKSLEGEGEERERERRLGIEEGAFLTTTAHAAGFETWHRLARKLAQS